MYSLFSTVQRRQLVEQGIQVWGDPLVPPRWPITVHVDEGTEAERRVLICRVILPTRKGGDEVGKHARRVVGFGGDG